MGSAMRNPKLPVRIVRQGETLKATSSIDSLYESGQNIRHKLDYIECDYRALVKILRELYSTAKSAQRFDPRIVWLIGDYVISFFSRLDALGFYLVNQNETIAHDISISKSSMQRILSFRKRFSSISFVDPSIPWSRYRDKKVPLKWT
jgi:hypothetical protein